MRVEPILQMDESSEKKVYTVSQLNREIRGGRRAARRRLPWHEGQGAVAA